MDEFYANCFLSISQGAVDHGPCLQVWRSTLERSSHLGLVAAAAQGAARARERCIFHVFFFAIGMAIGRAADLAVEV